MGYIYDGMPLFKAVLESFNQAVSLVALKYNFSALESLMADDLSYSIAVYLCFALAACNAAVFAISIGHQRIWTHRQRKLWEKNECDKNLIIGYNKENLNICKSVKKLSEKGQLSLAITDNLTPEIKAALYTEGTPFLSYSSPKSKLSEKINYIFSKRARARITNNDDPSRELENILNMAFEGKDHNYTIIINTQSDDKNIALCSFASDFINNRLEALNGGETLSDKEKKKQIIKLFSHLSIYVFGDAKFEAIYSKIVESSNGCIHYINQYRQMAIDFIDRYPLTAFMNEDQIDYESSCIKEDVNINMAFIGFGKTAQQIFLTSVANNQFIEKSGDNDILKTVKYHIFDKIHAENDKNLNHSYYRYRNEFFNDQTIEKLKQNLHPEFPYKKDLFRDEIKTKKYLPLPQIPSEEYYHQLDINDPSFYRELQRIATRAPQDILCIVVSFGSDLENLDMAHKLIEKKQEWNAKNFYVFVKNDSGDNSDHIFSRNEKDCFLIGNQSNTVYTFGKIVNNSLIAQALRRHKVYSLEYDLAHGYASSDQASIDNSYSNAVYNWFVERTQIERDSNLYGTLSLRSKLNLMGMDCVPKDACGKALSEEEYIKEYAKGDMPKYIEGMNADGKKICEYPIDFPASRRKSMAVHEHYRWNSYILSHGIVPSDIDTILEETTIKKGKDVFTNGKNYKLRRHGNLTTFEGLVDFRRLVAERDGTDEAQEDVIKYDYQILDDAYWFLDEFGYKIVKR